MLLRAGINHFIDLTGVGELRPYRDIVGTGSAGCIGVRVGYVRFPIDDAGVPRSREWMARILDAIDAALDDGRDRLRSLLGRRWPDRYRGWLLAGPPWRERSIGPGAGRHVVARRGKGLAASPDPRRLATRWSMSEIGWNPLRKLT